MRDTHHRRPHRNTQVLSRVEIFEIEHQIRHAAISIRVATSSTILMHVIVMGSGVGGC
jgi:hypothetical protein